MKVQDYQDAEALLRPVVEALDHIGKMLATIATELTDKGEES